MSEPNTVLVNDGLGGVVEQPEVVSAGAGATSTSAVHLSREDYDDVQAMLAWWRSRQGQKERR